MYTRLLTFSGIKDIDGALSYLREKVQPVVSGQKGYRGMAASADRSQGIFGVISLWETEADREASFGALSALRDESVEQFGGQLQVDSFEQLVDETVAPPGPGAVLLIQQVSMDPARIEENAAFFKSEIVPQIKATPGFVGLRHLINRQTGEGLVGTVWKDEAALTGALEKAMARRPVAEARGVKFAESSRREVLYGDRR
jgi:heme-degrading monooxygenase HmoA